MITALTERNAQERGCPLEPGSIPKGVHESKVLDVPGKGCESVPSHSCSLCKEVERFCVEEEEIIIFF